MANTSVSYTGNGSTTNYSFTFEYLKEAEVKVTLDGTATTAFTFANATTLSFTTAPGSGVAIRIFRDTDVAAAKATFFAGSAIKAEDLNDNFTQTRFAVEEIKENTWDVDTETIKSNETWVSADTQIATTAAMDARFQDEATETITSSETWPNNDDTIATTAAIDDRIDTAITNDIAGSDGVSITNDGDGTITVGLSSNSVDFDRIKNDDIITYAEQNAGSPSPADTNIFTASAAARRFDTLVQTGTPSGTDWATGKTWLQNDADKTLSIWDGDSWEGITSGGTFTSLDKVVYVDATNGNDSNEGHRISSPKKTIKAAITQINADATHGDGSVVIVAPGVYQEACPIQIQKRDVAIIGQSVRQCIVHPTVATQTATMFEVNSGSYLANLTFTGMKASGTRGESGSLWTNATYGLPATQGWNVAFYAGATIVKSPYIQNCTNFSDSEIDNSNLNFYSGTEDAGRAGDQDSAMTGGGLLIDGSTPAADSPLRSIVCDSYTHVGLDGPGIFVTNNGYAQCTSSYAFFNHFHIACHNGGQANLAASTSDFGRFSLITDGKSPNPIFTSTVDGAASSGATTFNIDAPTAGTDLYGGGEAWFGTAQRPANNMLVEVNSVIYPILSATANGSGWTVTISRPDSTDRSNNLGLNGAIADEAAVNFYLRSMIASSGHTMEYVGSGTDYSALPENGGVPDETKEITELNNGKVWTAITNHVGKFRIGGNQTDPAIFEVDQQLGFVTIPDGSISFSLASDATPQLAANLDAQTNKITNLGAPTANNDAATKTYVDTEITSATSGISSPSFTATASGSLSDGTKVIVKSDGTVAAVTGSSVTDNVGTAVDYESGEASHVACAFDANAGKVVVAYKDETNSSYGTAIVGTVSGNAVSFGTAVVFNSANTNWISVAYDANAQKVVISYDTAFNGTAIVGTVSGTSISFGTAVEYQPDNNGVERTKIVYDSNAQKVVIAYTDKSNSNYGTAIVGTVSGTSISFGTDVVFESASIAQRDITFDSSNNKVVIAYRDQGNSSHGTAIVGTVSGTSISFGTAVVFEAAQSEDIAATFDSNSNKVVIAYTDVGNSNHGTAIVGTVSGTSISFGTPVIFEAAATFQTGMTFDPDTNKVIIAYEDQGDSNKGKIIVGTVSGTSISFGTPLEFEDDHNNYNPVYDTTNDRTFIAYQSASKGTGIVFQTGAITTNLTSENYIGISNGAYSDGATATIQTAGAVDDAQSSLTPGQSYYVQVDGTLSTTADDPSVFAGTAVATTKLIVKG